MSGLAAGWEADYDGSRWFYRYKSTGLTQYTFPKAGDEFPEHVGTGHEAFNLAPEERLASNRQVKKRTSPSSSPTRGSRGAAAVVGGMSATTGYFDPLAWHDDFDVSPDTPGGGDLKGQGTVSEPASTVPSLAATPASAPPATLASGSPDAVDGVVVGGENDSVSAAIEEAIVHMLDGRPIAREVSGTHQTHTTSSQSSPIGNVAELPSGDTAKCAEELAPIEMDGASSEPGFSGTHVNPYAPAELSNEGVSTQAKKPESEKSNLTATSGRQDVPQTEKIVTVGDIQRIGIKAWTPAGRLGQDSSSNTRPLSMNSSGVNPPRPNTFRSWNSEVAITDPKRHSISGTLPSSGSVERHPTVLTPAKVPKTAANLKTDPATKGLLRSPIPSILRPARGVVPKQDVQIPGTNARHDSISTEIPATKATTAEAAMAHFPSVLKPAGRQKGMGNTAALALRPAQPENRPRADSLHGQRDIPISHSEKIYQRRPVSMFMEHRSVSAAELDGLSSAHSRPTAPRHVSAYPHGGMVPPRPSTTVPDHPKIVHELSTGNDEQAPSGQLSELSSVGQTSSTNVPKEAQAKSSARVAPPAQTTPYPPSEAPSQASSPAVSMLSVHQPSDSAHSLPASGMSDVKSDTNVTVEPIYPVAASFSSRDVEAASMVNERSWPKPAVDYSGDSWGDEW
ncbi:tRNA (adenine-N(1)-)-methyltransferase catalytic subunit trm61 [Pestalotiopsis sp. 9143b]|nr:tRNA (adenine-N(1)-)-methyltransferase catalytic subunit trm61 [Pestalotiopsis sp. 9143b]